MQNTVSDEVIRYMQVNNIRNDGGDTSVADVSMQVQNNETMPEEYGQW